MLSREKCAYSHDCVMAVFFFLGGAHIMKTKSIITIVAAAAVLIMAAAVAASGVETAATFWALVPPIVAIGLALITKEVYSSLFLMWSATALSPLSRVQPVFFCSWSFSAPLWR